MEKQKRSRKSVPMKYSTQDKGELSPNLCWSSFYDGQIFCKVISSLFGQTKEHSRESKELGKNKSNKHEKLPNLLYRKFFFFPCPVNSWNNLPDDIKQLCNVSCLHFNLDPKP